MKHAPCKDCEDRAFGCHSRCPVYISWRNERDQLIDKRSRVRKQEEAVNDLHFHRVRKGAGK